MTQKFILTIDQGTTSSKATLFDDKGQIVEVANKELKRLFPKEGYVEQIAQDIIDVSFQVIREVLSKHGDKDIVSLGIVNQRETVIVWDKITGKALYNAIVWQDRRTDDWCKKYRKEYDLKLKNKTGLILDAYFSASKIKWILDNVPEAQILLKQDRVICGTVDTFLLWHLTKGKQHLTDASNASRTLLYNINKGKWDKDLLKFFKIPTNILPKVKNSCDDFGVIDNKLFGRSIPINALIGDQQAATIGQGCLESGMGKITFGTGCFMMLNTGKKQISSKNGLLTTVLYSLDGKITYALEGSCFYAGAVIQWLRDNLELIKSADETQDLAKKAKDIRGLYFVPAFGGLGAPYWNSEARGVIKGITNQTGKNEIVKAALDAIIFQSYDLIKAMEDDGMNFSDIRIDGGMVKNDWFNQRLASILKAIIEVPKNIESTSLGAALFAGVGAGIFKASDIVKFYQRKEKKFPQDLPNLEEMIKGWHLAVSQQ